MTNLIKLGVAARTAVANTIQTNINAALDAVYAAWQLTTTLQMGVAIAATGFISVADLGASGIGEALFDGANPTAEIVQVNFASRTGSGPFTYSLASGSAFKIAHLAGVSILSEPHLGTIIPKSYPAAVYNGMRLVIPSYPAIVVSSVRGKQTENGAPYWAQVDHFLDITVGIVGDDEFVLDQEIDRYLVAIWEIIMQNQPLDGTLTGKAGVDPLGYGKSGAFKPSNKSLLTHMAGWEVVVHVVESV